MPTLFCSKKTGKPSSKKINIATIKNIGESKKRMMSESILFRFV